MSPFVRIIPDLTRLEPCGCRLELGTDKVVLPCRRHEPFEVDIDKLRQANCFLQDLVATWQNVAKGLSRLCALRLSGFCAAECAGQMVCNLEGLSLLPWADLPERFKELLCPPG